MSITVYHIMNNSRELYLDVIIRPTKESIEKALKEGMYKKVASVDTHDLEDAFHQTNSVESHWSENKAVTQIDDIGDKNKSTSVGDLMLHENRLYYVASFGFEELSQECISMLPKDAKTPKP